MSERDLGSSFIRSRNVLLSYSDRMRMPLGESKGSGTCGTNLEKRNRRDRTLTSYRLGGLW